MSSIPLLFKLRSTLAGVFRRRLSRMRNQFLTSSRESCRRTQRETLQGLLELNGDSQFSADHRLKSGLTVSEFRDRLPVSDYSLVAPYIDRMKTGDHRALLGSDNRLLMYALTSGTTAKSKLIPVTDRFIKDYRRGWQHWGVGTHLDHRVLRYLTMVQVGSSHKKFKTEDGTDCGNISGLVAAMQSPFVKSIYTIPSPVAHLSDPDAKRDAVVRFAIADPWAGMLITANPGTVLQLADHAEQHAERLIRDIHDGTLSWPSVTNEHLQLSPWLKKNVRRARQLEEIVRQHGSLKLSACWPHLTMLGVWSGGSAGAYLPQIKSTFGDVLIRDHGLHASEGRMTIPIDDHTPSGILDIESHFFEFIPVREADSANPVVLEAHELEEGGEYLILLTTSSGLYRYNIRDVVRCTGFYGTTPMLEFRHKGAHISSITGEKIAESQVVEAVRKACEDTCVGLRQFTLTPRWGNPPAYTLYVRPEGTLHSADSLIQLARQADERLQRGNCEYLEKRDTQRLSAMTVRVLPSETWERFAENRITATGGSVEQYKHPCLVPDPRFERLFLKQCGLDRPIDGRSAAAYG